MRRPLAALALVLLVSACGDDPRVVETDDLTVLVAGERSGGTDVALSGILGDVDGCLGLLQTRHVAVFPAGSEPADDGRSVTLSDGSVLSVGDSIESGGETYGGGLGPQPDGTPSIPDECGDVAAALLTDPVLAE